MELRKAKTGDVAECVELVEARRLRYEKFEPQFWRRADDSRNITVDWFTTLFSDADVLSLVAVEESAIVGFLIARDVPAPPVYNPGGPTALVDDFCVAEDRWMDVGGNLLTRAKEELRSRGCVQIVVVGANKDIEKTAFLESANLSLASTWWTSST